MSATIEGRSEELLQAKNFCLVSTIRSDGSVHSAPVWVDVQDGRPVLNTAEGRAWPRNLERDPRVTLTVQNMDNPYEYVAIRGRVAERTHDGADEHIDAMAKKYLGQDTYPFRQPGEQRVIIKVDPGVRARLGRLSRCDPSSRAAQQPPPQRRGARLGAQPLVAQSQLSRGARPAARTRCGRAGATASPPRARSAYAR